MIRPAYWTDDDLQTRLNADQREFYIGLWMLADDAGYVAWDVQRVGAELYPFRSPAWRSRRLPEWLALLGPSHAELLACGRHVVIPNLPRYQSPPRPSHQVQRAHDTCMQMAPRGAKWDQMAPAQSKGREEKGVGLNGGGDRAADMTPDGPSLKALVGWKP